MIAPGINLSMQALHDAAAQLPRVAIRRPTGNRVIGVDTVEAMQSGVFWGYIAMIEGLVDAHQGRVGQAADRDRHRRHRLAVRGRHRRRSTIFDHDLTIRGLLEIYRRNTHLAAG